MERVRPLSAHVLPTTQGVAVEGFEATPLTSLACSSLLAPFSWQTDSLPRGLITQWAEKRRPLQQTHFGSDPTTREPSTEKATTSEEQWTWQGALCPWDTPSQAHLCHKNPRNDLDQTLRCTARVLRTACRRCAYSLGAFPCWLFFAPVTQKWLTRKKYWNKWKNQERERRKHANESN